MSMRNLKLLHVGFCHPSETLTDCCSISVDYDTKHVYGTTRDGSVILFDPNTRQVLGQVSLVESGHLTKDGQCSVVGTQHLPDQMALCVAISGGDILLWTPDSNQVECVGTIENGIQAMSWSPDMELVAFVIGHNGLMLMTRDFDPVMETAIHQESFGEAQPVSVGWGKKETQFHGSEGKKAAHVKKNENINIVLPSDDNLPRISWRGDGQFFAVSVINPNTGSRQIRVWTREGILHSTSEDVVGLGQCLNYKPSGSLVASSAHDLDLGKHTIVFFEKNGLRHGEFVLPFNGRKIKVLEVNWNMDSSVVAVWCEDLPTVDSTALRSYIQLWSCGNYHWYLKQNLEFNCTSEERVSVFLWDPELPYCLHIVFGNGRYRQYTWSWMTDCSRGQTAADLASVAVIDGADVLVTPFSRMVVPPPLSAFKLRLPSSVDVVLFTRSPHSNDLLVLTNDHRLVLYAFSEEERSDVDDGTVVLEAAGGNGFLRKCPIPRLGGAVSLKNIALEVGDDSAIAHLTCIDKNSTFLLSLMRLETASLVHLTVDWERNELLVRSRMAVEKTVMAISFCEEMNSMAIQLIDGQILRFDPASDVLSQWNDHEGRVVKFPYACAQMAVTRIGDREVVVGLTERYRLYINDVELANNCSSFAIHDEFFLMTTHSHTCRCICRKTNVEELLSLSSSKSHIFDETIRRIERGSRIVTVVPDDTKLVLQMPRGNIEAIHPRALVLSVIRKHLDRLEFSDAFRLAKKHRISMNLLYDHNPSTFLSNARQFVVQLETTSNINLFLTDLVEEDVTVKMYTFAYKQRLDNVDKVAISEKAQLCSKLNVVCEAMRKELEECNEEKYVLSILTTYVKKTIPDLESALLKIKSVRDRNSTVVNYVEALEYLLYLVDVNRLYDVALGTYDFDLVLMVAEKSQKDPKEYLPYLNGLKKMEDNYRCFSIDLYLKRFTKALLHISRCGKECFEECMKLVVDHNLYRQALSLYSHHTNEYKELSIAYGRHLGTQKHFEEAGLIYARANEHERALEMFESCLNWRQALCMANILDYARKETGDLSRRLAKKLSDLHRHDEAACLLEQYADDHEEAIVTLIAGNQWNEALRLIYKYKRTDFIETDVKPSQLKSYAEHKVLIETTKSDFQRHAKRLTVVRQEKKLKQETFDGLDGPNHPDSDLYSDTSSVSGESAISHQSSRSASSRTSGRTAKSRLKQEKKKWSLREGSPYEEEALVEELHKMISRTQKWKEEISSLLQMLVLFYEETEARELQSCFEDLIGIMDKSIPEIWTPQLMGIGNEFNLVMGPDSTPNSITRDMQNLKLQPQRSLQLDNSLRIPPIIDKNFAWKLSISDALSF